MDCSTPGLPFHHQLSELTQTHVHWVGDDIQPSHPLSSSSPPAFNLSQYQGLFQWVSSLHQVPRVLEFQLQHLEGLGGIYFLVFSNFWKLLEVLVFLCRQSQQWWVEFLHLILLTSDLLFSLCFPLLKPCDYIGSTQTIQDNVCISRSWINNLNAI